MASLPGLGICLDPAWIHESAPGQLPDFMAACQDRLCYLHLYDAGAESGHLPVGSGDVPKKDWRNMLICMQEIGFTGPAVFEVFPAPDSGVVSTLEAVQVSLHFLDGL